MLTELWPPLSVIRGSLDHDMPAPGHGATPVVFDNGTGAAAAGARAAPNLLLPLTELARRREAVARRAFPARWAPGRLISVVHEGRLLGVLLDKPLAGDYWQGWLAASEADWAGAYDVLLEPDDEPFDPLFGMVQAWNVLTLEQAPQLCARVLGEVSATRLAAIRAVHDEWAAGTPPAIDPEPGRIALRTAGGVFSVLSGTPLGAADPREAYQSLYREAAVRLGTTLQAAPVPPRALAQADAGGEGAWARVQRWFGADRIVRPAFALLALVVVVQNIGLLRSADDEEEVRFRGTPPVGAPAAAAPADVVLRWKAGVAVEDAQRLLRSQSAEVVGGPDASGGWRLRLAGGADTWAALQASPLVESVSYLAGEPAPR